MTTGRWRAWGTRIDWTANPTVPQDIRTRRTAFLQPVCAVIADLAATLTDATDDDLIAVLGPHGGCLEAEDAYILGSFSEVDERRWLAQMKDDAAYGVGLAVLLLASGATVAYAQAPSGEAIYQRRCAACHERPADGRTPGRETLQNMTSARILRTLDFGAMTTIAYQLRRDEREAVARFLGKPTGDPQPRPEAFCRDRTATVDTSASPIWNGWSPSPDNARFAPASLAKLTPDQAIRRRLATSGRRSGSKVTSPRSHSRQLSGIRCSSAAPAASCTPSVPTLVACSGRFKPPARFGLRSLRRHSRADRRSSLAISLDGSTRWMPRAEESSGERGQRNTRPFA